MRSESPLPPSKTLDPALGSFLHAVTAADNEALRQWFLHDRLDENAIRWLCSERLAPYVFYRLKKANLLTQLTESSRLPLRAAYYASAAQNALLNDALRQLSVQLISSGVRVCVLKGMALASSLYPAAPTRPSGDLDILVQKSEIAEVKHALVSLGYCDMGIEPEAHQAWGNHLHMWRPTSNGARVIIEVHWHLVHDPGFARRINLEASMARSMPVDFGGSTAMVLDPVDQLIHACAHLLLHHSREWIVGWLLDVHLLIARYGPIWDWVEVIRRAQDWQLAGALRYWVEITECYFGPSLPLPAQQALQKVQPSAYEAPYLIGARAAQQFVWDNVLRRASGIANRRQRLTYLGELFFPPWTYMQYRYAAGTRWLAPIYYGWRLLLAARIAVRQVRGATDDAHRSLTL